MSCRTLSSIQFRINLKKTGFPFDSAQGGESFDVAQDHEPVEWPVEPRVKPGMTKRAYEALTGQDP